MRPKRVQITLPDGWEARTFPTVMSGEVIRFYRGEYPDGQEVVNVSRDGVAVASGVYYTSSAEALDDLRAVLDAAEAQADRLAPRRGSWIPRPDPKRRG